MLFSIDATWQHRHYAVSTNAGVSSGTPASVLTHWDRCCLQCRPWCACTAHPLYQPSLSDAEMWWARWGGRCMGWQVGQPKERGGLGIWLYGWILNPFPRPRSLLGSGPVESVPAVIIFLHFYRGLTDALILFPVYSQHQTTSTSTSPLIWLAEQPIPLRAGIDMS